MLISYISDCQAMPNVEFFREILIFYGISVFVKKISKCSQVHLLTDRYADRHSQIS